MKRKKTATAAMLACAFALVCVGPSDIRAQDTARLTASPVGMFESQTDVGKALHPGSVEYDAAQQTYTIASSGKNMWFGEDAFHFAWKKASGDVTLTADISFLGDRRNAAGSRYRTPNAPLHSKRRVDRRASTRNGLGG